MAQTSSKTGTAPDNSAVLMKYQQALQNLPASGGNGCHPGLLGIANYGIFAGVSTQQIFSDIRSQVDRLSGSRKIPDREISEAIKRALLDADKNYKPTTYRPRINGAKIREAIIKDNNMTEADLWELSPVKLPGEAVDDKLILLKTLYEPNDLLFIGKREDPGIIGQTIRSASDWMDYFEAGGESAEHIIPNPLTGKLAQLKNGDGETFRGDGCIAKFKFIVVEFDTIPREQQIAFWARSGLPLYCLIDSGGKSIHGWVRIDGIQDAKRWQTVIRDCLFPKILVPMGVDSACKNESRLSRLPGHFREDKGKAQRLLWLSKEGKQL